MYYHFSVILSFYPLIHFEFPDSKISAIEVCTDAANAVAALIRSYESLHGLRRTPCFLPYIILASGVAHLVTADSETKPVDTLNQPTQGVAIKQLTSLFHRSSKRARRSLLSGALYPTADRGSKEGSEADGDSPWEPFIGSMMWPGNGSTTHRPFH